MIILISERDMSEKVSLWNHDCYANIDLTRYVSKGLDLDPMIALNMLICERDLSEKVSLWTRLLPTC